MRKTKCVSHTDFSEIQSCIPIKYVGHMLTLYCRSPKKCCAEVMEEWVKNNNGEPKTWNKFIEVLNNIKELQSAVGEIKQDLMSHGVELSGMYIHTYMCVCVHACVRECVRACVGVGVITIMITLELLKSRDLYCWILIQKAKLYISAYTYYSYLLLITN